MGSMPSERFSNSSFKNRITIQVDLLSMMREIVSLKSAFPFPYIGTVSYEEACANVRERGGFGTSVTISLFKKAQTDAYRIHILS
jgi:hypothetical protein